MRKMYFLKLALSEFKVHKRRLLLTSFALAWGTLTILLLLAFGEGLKKQFSKSGKGIGENLVVVWGGQTSIPYQGLPAGRGIRFTKEDIELLKKSIPEIKSISGEYNQWSVNGTVGKIERSTMVVGVKSEFGEMRNQIPQWGSRFLHPSDIRLKRRVVFMGWESAKTFFPDEDPVGKQIILNNVPFTVVGVLKEKMQSSNYNNMDKNKSYIPEPVFEAMFGYRHYNNIVYSLNKLEDAPHVEKRFYEVLGAKYKFDPKDKMCLSFWDVIKMHEKSGKVFLGIQIFMGIMGGLTLLISGVGLANIMYVSIKKRTREIGVKIALGAHPKQILKQIIVESFFFSGIGGGLGAFTAVLLVTLIKNVPIDNEAMEFLTNPVISREIALMVISILATITFLAGYFPAKKAAAQNPIESLRYE